MTIADGMHQIVDTINEARASRVSDIAGLVRDVGEIRYDARKSLKSLNKTRKHNAIVQSRALHKGVKALRHDSQDMFSGFSAQRLAMAQESREKLNEFTTQLKKDVTDIRLDATHMIHGFADERVHRGIELTRMLSSYNEGIVGDVQHLMGFFRQVRVPFQEDLAEAHTIWQSQQSGGHSQQARQANKPVSHAPKKSETPAETADASLKEKILRTINKSPRGISLSQAGKKTGVEWRKLVRPVKELLEEGAVRKEDTRYFRAN
ncbi:MAG: hypothetical protein LUQ31_03020 [Methanoregula sp.]|nr:hypothetical protein [Methanoregula sp.]